MTRPEVHLPPLVAPVDELWHVILDLGHALAIPWTLVGGQMVLLHALEHGHIPPQISQDGDIVADVRTRTDALTTLVSVLLVAGFDLDGMSTDGLAHRYSRPAMPKPVVIDVLAPEGLGTRTDLTTTPPGRTLEVPGGTQALERTQFVDVVHEGRTGAVPRPSLLAAVIAKATACRLPGNSSRHLRDLALLCALVADPYDMRSQMSDKDKRRMRSADKLAAPDHVAWQLVPRAVREQGYEAFLVLTNARRLDFRHG